MTLNNNLKTQLIQFVLLGKLMLIGGAIALTVISIFLLGVRNPNPAWGTIWMVRLLIIVTTAGAAGGAFAYFMHYLIGSAGWRKGQ